MHVDRDLGPDGWADFSEVHGWYGYTIVVQVAVMDGQPRAVGVRLEPVPGAEPVTLDSASLRRLPVTKLARVAKARQNAREHTSRDAAELRADVDALAELVLGNAPKVNEELIPQVAAVWHRAHEAGEPTYRAVQDECHLGQRTADRYIARARDRGLIPTSTRDGAGLQSGRSATKTKKEGTQVVPRISKPKPGEPIRLITTKAGQTRYEAVLTSTSAGTASRYHGDVTDGA